MNKSQKPDGALLPQNLGEGLEATQVNLKDEVIALKDTLESTQSALGEEQEKNSDLENEIILLRDNHKIKTAAVSFAKLYLIFIPVLSVILLIISANQGFTLFFIQHQFYWGWNFEIGRYTQTALVIAPIAFVATVLGFMIKGVLGGSNQGNKDQYSELLKVLLAVTKNKNFHTVFHYPLSPFPLSFASL